MLRDHLFSKRAPADPDFRWRGGDVSRVEGISDGVFAITITLLVVSTNVPSRFADLWQLFVELPAFLASFALIMMAWYYHYVFFRRYGLEDFTTIALNSLFLFLIMFFAFPLKFLALFLWYLIIGEPTAPLFSVDPTFDFHGWVDPAASSREVLMFQRFSMMLFYGIGLFGVFASLALMQWRAWRKRLTLELDELEIGLTKVNLGHLLIAAGVSCLSLIVLFTTQNPGLSGITYFLMPIAHPLWGWFSGRNITKIQA